MTLKIVLKALVTVFYMGMLYMNYLANSLPIGGNNTGDLSDKYDTLFTPAGFTFSIWGIIYLLVGAYVIYVLFLPLSDIKEINMVIMGLFLLSCLLNVSWLLAWHNERILLSSIVMVVFLITLLAIVQNQDNDITKLAFGLYAAWICVALTANIAITIVKYDVSFFMNNPVLWLVIVLIVVVLITGYMVFIEKNIYFGLVAIWAFFGIASKLQSKEMSIVYLIYTLMFVQVVNVIYIALETKK